MVLPNAERQRRFRERQKEKLQAAPGAHRPCLSPEDELDRAAVIADPIYPVPKDTTQLPRFMGWHRYEWPQAPDPMAQHFDMTDAVAAWRLEIDEMCVRSGMPPEFDRGALYAEWKKDSDRRVAEYRALMAQGGEIAQTLQREGRSGLARALNKNPDLGKAKARSRRAVTNRRVH